MQKGKLKTKNGFYLTWPNMALRGNQNISYFRSPKRENRRERREEGEEEEEEEEEKEKKKRREEEGRSKKVWNFV